MGPFKQDLSKAAHDVSVSVGTGGWEGGSEDTWATTFRNGPEALSVIAKHAKAHDQDAAIVMKGARKGDPGAVPHQRLRFDRFLDGDTMRGVEADLVGNGIGGWTWTQESGNSVLVVQTISDWGGDPESDLASVQGLRAALGSVGINTRYQLDWMQVTIMERDTYDKFILD
jgi:hypothetical protein